MQQLRGTGVALITPFAEDLSVDTAALKKLVDHVISGGVEYLVVLGTTAESATLSKEEKEQVISVVVEANADRVPLVLGVGGNNTARICEELKLIDLSHFCAILSVSPYYSRPTQAGIYAHFEKVAEASPLPIILYNVPARTGSNMLPETVIKLATNFKNIVGIKEAAGDMVQVLQLLKNRPSGFMIISGDDLLALPTVMAGGDGVISVIGQGLPEIFSTMIRDGLSGKLKEANTAQYKLLDLFGLIFAEGNPAGIKTLLSLKKISHSQVRLPLVKASEDLTNKLQQSISGLSL